MAMGECSAYNNLEWVEFNAPPDTILVISEAEALTDFRPEEPQWTLAYGWRRRWQHYKYRRGVIIIIIIIIIIINSIYLCVV